MHQSEQSPITSLGKYNQLMFLIKMELKSNQDILKADKQEFIMSLDTLNPEHIMREVQDK